MTRGIPQDCLNLGDFIERIDAFEGFMCDDGDPKMLNTIRLDVVRAFEGVSLLDESAASCQPLELITLPQSEEHT